MIITKQAILRESPDMVECVRFMLRGVSAGTRMESTNSKIVTTLPWRVDFGDGTRSYRAASEQEIPSHVYEAEGDYDVVLYGRLTGVSSRNFRSSPILGNGQGVACPALKEVVFAADALTAVIDSGTFRLCRGLERVVLPPKLVILGTHAFRDCISLRELDLPETISTISNSAFNNCTALEKFTIHATEPPEIASDVFASVPRTIPVYVPAEALAAYRESDVWKEFNLQPIG